MRALFVGRFQPLHKGHVHAIKDAMKRYEVVIVIGSVGKRSFENPFSFRERKRMIESVFGKKLKIVGVRDFNDDERWVEEVEKKVKFDIVISGNEWTRRCFRKAGYKLLYPKFLNPTKYSGKEIRRRIVEGKKWEHLVPEQVVEIVKEVGGEERIKKLFQRCEKGKS